MRRKAGTCPACVLALCCALAPAAVVADAPLPYRLSVSVGWGQPVGPESLRDRLEAELVSELRRAACFGAVLRSNAPGAEAASLSLSVLLDGYREETDYEYTVHQRGAPDLDTSRGALSRVEADVHSAITSVPQASVVRERRFKHRANWRPLWQEDARDAAQREFVEGITRSVRKFACKGSAAKWAGQIERASTRP